MGPGLMRDASLSSSNIRSPFWESLTETPLVIMVATKYGQNPREWETEQISHKNTEDGNKSNSTVGDMGGHFPRQTPVNSLTEGGLRAPLASCLVLRAKRTLPPLVLRDATPADGVLRGRVWARWTVAHGGLRANGG
ncbi:hypothetical protein AAG570_009514 [Ranatra chinensis]|uniref:Uncharacterized protein n=1 Tax=Ranatra chinensis TaxID=642074 RepID=A0ABD0Z6E0_9HEMI